MSMHLRDESKVPEETPRMVRAAFPKSSDHMTLRDELETIYTYSQFTPLF
jgi:transposase